MVSHPKLPYKLNEIQQYSQLVTIHDRVPVVLDQQPNVEEGTDPHPGQHRGTIAHRDRGEDCAIPGLPGIEDMAEVWAYLGLERFESFLALGGLFL